MGVSPLTRRLLLAARDELLRSAADTARRPPAHAAQTELVMLGSSASAADAELADDVAVDHLERTTSLLAHRFVRSQQLPCRASQRDATRPRLLLSASTRCTAPAAIDRYLLLSSKPASRCCCCRSTGQTNGRTPDRYIGHSPQAMRAVSITSCYSIDIERLYRCCPLYRLRVSLGVPS